MRRRPELDQRAHDTGTKLPPPVDVELDPSNEAVVLAAMVVDTPTREKYARELQGDHFFAPGHAPLFTALQEIVRRNLQYDHATLQRIAGDKIDLRYVQLLEETRPTVPPNLAFHVDALKWDRARARAVQGPVASLLDALRNPQEEPARVKALAKHVGSSFDGVGATLVHEPAELVRSQMAEIRARVAGEAIYPYGIPGLDLYENGRRRMLEGTAPGKNTVLVAMPGTGKSSFVSNSALGIAGWDIPTPIGGEPAREGRGVHVLAWEMGGGTTIEIMAALSLGFSLTDLTEGRDGEGRPTLTAAQLDDLERRMGELLESGISFSRNPFRRRGREKRTNDSNLELMEQAIAESGAEVVFADLFKRALVETDPDAEEDALFQVHTLLGELRVHGVLVHQLRSKDVSRREDPRPTAEGAKGSSAWFEIADTMIGLHRPWLFKRGDDDKIQAFILKQKRGVYPIAVELDWDPKLGRICGGKSIEYAPPGEVSSRVDKFMAAPKSKRKP
ncbi:MAG: hypothetical protein PVSMB8_02960 [Vulcanimicrobiaceae bacterium]